MEKPQRYCRKFTAKALREKLAQCKSKAEKLAVVIELTTEMRYSNEV